MPDPHFRGLVKLTDWSCLTSHDRYHSRSTRALQHSVALALCNATSPFKRFPRYRVIYRQIIYPGYISYDKVNSKKSLCNDINNQNTLSD